MPGGRTRCRRSVSGIGSAPFTRALARREESADDLFVLGTENRERRRFAAAAHGTRGGPARPPRRAYERWRDSRQDKRDSRGTACCPELFTTAAVPYKRRDKRDKIIFIGLLRERGSTHTHSRLCV